MKREFLTRGDELAFTIGRAEVPLANAKRYLSGRRPNARLALAELEAAMAILNEPFGGSMEAFE